MIDKERKQKLLEEIVKLGNVCRSCLKTGVDKATYYRWKKGDKNFQKLADEAEKIGRENFCDLAEHSLAQNVLAKNQRAIEYVLSHNSEKYKQRQTSQVIIIHKKELPAIGLSKETLEDLLDKDEQTQPLTGTVGSKSVSDKPPVAPQENQIPSDKSGLDPSTPNKKPDSNT